MSLLLGIDTGGTYTDAVLYQDSGPNLGVIAKAKALTTREDLSLGIGAVVERVLADPGVAPGDIALTSVSTTLATNALVEGQGGRVALVFIGFTDADVDRAGLRDALAGDPVIHVAGGHTPLGEPREPLDLATLRKAAAPICETVEAFAIVAHFGVRNPSHELQARDVIHEISGLPVTCGHELSAQLGGPKRALTCVLNARLVGMIAELVDATEAILECRGILAPLMLVRGDGSLVTAEFARKRPIETILSGPAASLIGAAHLTGLTDAIISDIGGTTTDIAVLREGRPELNPNGASVGGYQTMVEAIDMVTHGLGGDSEVWFDKKGRGDGPRLGPRRLIPVSLLSRDYPGLVDAVLERQARRDMPAEYDGRFLLTNRRLLGRAAGLRDAERRLLDAIGDGPVPQDEIVTRRLQLIALGRLVDLGLVRVSGFTPSDAAHVVGLHEGWDGQAAACVANLIARQRDALGGARAASGDVLAEQVIAAVKRRSAELVLAAAFAKDGLAGIDPSTSKLVKAALDGPTSATRVDIGVKLPVIGLGASAPTYYPDVAKRLGAVAAIPEHAEVANALGAVVGGVEIRREITILVAESGAYRVPGHPASRDFATLEPALAHARSLLKEIVGAEARAAGAADVEYRERIDEKTAEIDGKPVFIESRMSLTATGRPRLRRVGGGPMDSKPDVTPSQAIRAVLRSLQGQVAKHGANKEWERVALLCRRMMTLTPEAGTPLRNFAVARALTQGAASARGDYHRAMLALPGAASTAHDQAVNERRSGHYPSSLRATKWSLCLEPGVCAVYLSAGSAAFGVKDFGQTWDSFLKARIIQPDNVTALSNIVEILTRKGHHGQIARATRRWLCADPAASGAGSILASAWTSIARVGEATEVARRTLLMNPLDGKLQGTIARAELKSGAYEKAIKSACRYALINPRSAYALLTLAEASVNREDLSLCMTSSTWLRVISSDRGRNMASAVNGSGRPAVYVHVPKTAGSSIQRSTYDFTTSIGHRWIEQEPTEEDKHYTVWVAPNLLIKKAVLDQRYLFSNTRHLLPLLVSFYEHCRRGFASPSMIELVGAARKEPFVDFVQRIAGQDTPWISRRFIFAPFFERSGGHFLIDWLNRTEAVDDDLPEMCRLRGFPYRGVGTLNKEVDKDWRSYYDDNLVDLAWDVWAREVAMFGYTRDGGYSDDALLHRDVSRFKPRLTYDWRDDTIRLDGEIYDGRSAGINAVAAGR
jgi:N-methylhydantoinase A/oxoprolinase/acetone carboxylase beta subunit/tetratricopeptide (TPR) repeat protein